MLVTDTKEPASNWDFAPVFDLLRSHTYNETSAAHRHGCSVAAPSDSGGHKQPDDNQKRQRDPTSLSRPNNDTHGLGDFGSLWDLINRDPDSFRALEPEDTSTSISTNRQSHVRSHPRITILKRHSQDVTSGNSSSNASNTLATPIPVPTSSKNKFASSADIGSSSHPSSNDSTCKDSKRSSGKTTNRNSAIHSAPVFFSKCSRHKQDASMAESSSIPENGKLKEKFEAVSSEGSAEIDSDSIPTVFDRPSSQRPEHLTFIPGQVGTVDSRPGQYETPPSSFDDIESTLHSESVKNIITTSAGIRVLPVDYKSATERRIGLMTKLLKDFPEYAQLVSRVGQSLIAPQKGVHTRPIHVFVDMSNIMVGFHDSVKVSRNIPISTRIRRLHMSFANFSLIMERGRPVSKRVLVGSDRLPSIDEAKNLGYEANILERVHKFKHTTPRSSKLRKTYGNTTQQGNGGPETVGASNERWVEQGVDEILHLKILESLLDTDDPAIIVLATGDAAAAEYSDGFMRMVERALRRGWAVELVSFSQVISYSYRKKEFRAKWRDSFRLVELDSYVEELFE